MIFQEKIIGCVLEAYGFVCMIILGVSLAYLGYTMFSFQRVQALNDNQQLACLANGSAHTMQKTGDQYSRFRH